MKIIFLVADDWFFWSHRLPLARRMRDLGAEVLVMTRVDRYKGALEKENFRVIPWQLSPGSLNPFAELRAYAQVVRTYRREKPALVHHVAIKPVAYGGAAARLCGNIPSVNAITGLGHAYVSRSLGMRLLWRTLLVILRSCLRGRRAMTIFQNNENYDLLVRAGVVQADRAVIIRGAGVDLCRFSPRPEPDGVPVVVLAARMLWEKGVGEFVETARKLRERGLSARFALVGNPDPNNPGCIPRDQLHMWAASGAVEWWGQQHNMPDVFGRSNLVCLPSYYGEGLPKVLIEAAACGRAIVTTDVPGCRAAVRNGENGLLVPPRDPDALAEAMATLLQSPSLRARMGVRGREIAEQEFSLDRVVQQTLDVYRKLLGPRWAWDQSSPISQNGPAASEMLPIRNEK